MDKRYSVLMSVYKKERPEYLHAALKSMTGQSWRPSEIVLVCDGPLTTELEAVLEDIEFQGLLKTVRLLLVFFVELKPCHNINYIVGLLYYCVLQNQELQWLGRTFCF